MRPEPGEGQSKVAQDPGGLHSESDANAPIKGATPEGESEPDAQTKPGSLTGVAPDVATTDTEAGEATAEVEATGPSEEIIEKRTGMFGVQGSGDTSGYGGLSRTIELPPGSQPPYGGWWDQVNDRIGQIFSGGSAGVGPLADQLVPNYGDVIEKVVVHRGEITFHVARRHLATLVQHLRDDAHLRFEFCSSVSGVHYPQDKGRELHAVYHLQSMTYNRRIRLEVSAPDADPHIPSVVGTYPTADWHERETYDMFGLIFDGHPALTRILMPDDWPGYPQRKDYPLGGINVEYKGAVIPPPDQRRSYS